MCNVIGNPTRSLSSIIVVAPRGRETARTRKGFHTATVKKTYLYILYTLSGKKKNTSDVRYCRLGIDTTDTEGGGGGVVYLAYHLIYMGIRKYTVKYIIIYKCIAVCRAHPHRYTGI